MNYNGCKRKFSIPNYVKRIDDLVREVQKNHPGELGYSIPTTL
jgi:hypothetical protein